jgi:cell division protease FtsH
MPKPPQKQNQQTRMVAIFGAIMIAFLLFHLLAQPKEESSKIGFSEFNAATELDPSNTNRVTEVTFRDGEILGTRADESTFISRGPKEPDTAFLSSLQQKNIKVNFEPPEGMSWWKSALAQLLPFIIILFVFIFVMRQLQVGGGKAMSFGKSKAKLLNENQAKVTFDDVAGVDEAKQELEEIIDFLKDPKKYTKLGGRIPKGVLLIGPPGTGKTILAKAIAGEADVPFFSIAGSDFVEMFVGVGASRVRDLFEQAKKHAPCIIFIDEIDAVGRHRGAGMGGGHDEREQTLNQLLVEMDGFEGNEGVIVVAATNRQDVLDPALLRPGRFDRRVTVPNPDVKGRNGILKVHSKRSPLANDVKLPIIAQGTPGFSGADLENLCNEAALMAARVDAKEVAMSHFELAKDKILMGPERKSMVMGLKEKRNTAYHEAGHAMIGLKTDNVDPVHKVSIIPRGQALGVTVLLPVEDRHSLTKEYAEGMIAYAMGGRAAEEVVFHQQTTGASDDIKKATDIARRMVCNWGMSEKLGPLALGKQDQEVFLGRDMGGNQAYSEKIAEDIDKEIHRFVSNGYKKALEIIRANRDQFNEIAEALLIKETLNNSQMVAIINGEKIVSEEEIKEFYEAQNRPKATMKDAKKETASLKKEDSEEKDDDSPVLAPMPQGT